MDAQFKIELKSDSDNSFSGNITVRGGSEVVEIQLFNPDRTISVSTKELMKCLQILGEI